MADVKQKVALTSIAASAGLTAAKAVVGVMSGSLGLLSEAAHSLIDVGATVMTYFAVRISGKPADAEHHYGHGKVESVSALIETALLFVLAGVVSWEAIKRLMSAQPPEVEATPWAFAVIAGSIVVDFLRARVRQVGEVLFVDLVVAVSRTLPLDRVAALKDRIVERVRADSPAAEVTVTTQPRALDDETVLERVMVIARNRALAVHHVTVHAIEGRLAVSLDLEVDGALSLGAAHDIATGLEDAIPEKLVPV